MSIYDTSAYRNHEKVVEAGLIHLATCDESASYEIDENSLYYDPTTRKFLWRSASGCSCWDGEYGESWYDSLDDVEKELREGHAKDKYYHPSLSGTETLLREAREAFAKHVA